MTAQLVQWTSLLTDNKLNENDGTHNTLIKLKELEILTMPMCVTYALWPLRSVTKVELTTKNEVKEEIELTMWSIAPVSMIQGALKDLVLFLLLIEENWLTLMVVNTLRREWLNLPAWSRNEWESSWVFEWVVPTWWTIVGLFEDLCNSSKERSYWHCSWVNDNESPSLVCLLWNIIRSIAIDIIKSRLAS